jgi:hypothetical protein
MEPAVLLAKITLSSGASPRPQSPARSGSIRSGASDPELALDLNTV